MAFVLSMAEVDKARSIAERYSFLVPNARCQFAVTFIKLLETSFFSLKGVTNNQHPRREREAQYLGCIL